MKLEEKNLTEILQGLCQPLPEEAIQRTKGRETGKGYNTDGYGYQWLVDKLNTVAGLGHWQTATREVYTERGTTSKGRAQFEVGFDVQVSLGNWEAGAFEPLAQTPWTPGNHVSLSLGDARKGAMTNGFKKAVAFFGLGAGAFRGDLDPDNQPLPDCGDYRQPAQYGSRPPLAAVPDGPDYRQHDTPPPPDEYYAEREANQQQELPATGKQIGRIKRDLREYLVAAGRSSIDIKDERFIAAVTGWTGRPVSDYNDLTKNEASNLIDCLGNIVDELFKSNQQQQASQTPAAGSRRRVF